MVVFEPGRLVVDDRTFTAGGFETETRMVFVEYVDNRNAIGDTFWSVGYTDLTNLSNESRAIRYQFRVQMPPYHLVDLPPDERLCYDGDSDELIFHASCDVSPGDEVKIDWEFSVDVIPAGDLNMDGLVDSGDLGILLAEWGTNRSSDLDGSGVVDSIDLGILLEQWTG